MGVEQPVVPAAFMEKVFTELAGLTSQEFSRVDFWHDWGLQLLDPEGWRDTLVTYAATVRLAVAVTDREGRVLGTCHNPQPVWNLVHQGSSQVQGVCSFCVAPALPCSAVADALRTGLTVMVEDGAGLAHVAVPLTLGGQPLGALIAGQVFTHYAAPLRLQRVAREFSIPQQKLWHLAIRQVPVSQATLKVYGNLLMALGQSFLGLRYAALLHGKVAETNQRLSLSLQEKQVMLREIHHRVKNNLQIVSSLLNMQCDRLDDAQDQKALAVLKKSQQRIDSMAMIHDLLYSNEQIGEIDFGEYARSLGEMVACSCQAGAIRVHASLPVAPVVLSMHQAIPCGLIVNELVTNACKHAYPDNPGGDICIDIQSCADGRVSLTISDQGVGMPAATDWQQSDSLGFQIVSILARQLHGSIELNPQPGASFTLVFPRGTANGTATVTVQSRGGSSSGSVQVNTVAPGIYTANASGLASALAFSYQTSGSFTYQDTFVVNASGLVVANPISLDPKANTVVLELYGTAFGAKTGTALV